MKEQDTVCHAISTALGSLDHKDPMTPGIFDSAMSMLRNIGCRDAAVYLFDEYAECLRLVSLTGSHVDFPGEVTALEDTALDSVLASALAGVPRIKTYPLFSYGRHLGALAVQDNGNVEGGDKVLAAVVRVFSVLAYIETVRTNCQRERVEREVFFAQALTNRLLTREPPPSEYYRLGFERWRALEVGGDFFDFVPVKDGRVYVFIGRCSGTGVKTALEMVEIMHHIDRCFIGLESMKDIVAKVNQHLVEIKKRSHLASLCLLELDPHAEKVRMVRAGNFAIAICHSSHLHNISRESSLFLGMVNDLDMEEEEFEFKPGSALICATEGIFNIRNRLDQALPARVFTSSIEEARRDCSLKALINSTFERIRSVSEFTHAQDSFAAISVEFLERKR